MDYNGSDGLGIVPSQNKNLNRIIKQLMRFKSSKYLNQFRSNHIHCLCILCVYPYNAICTCKEWSNHSMRQILLPLVWTT